ncbi:MAG: hypothetical protein ABI665_24305 [Vicinamibacterales bacterium]
MAVLIAQAAPTNSGELRLPYFDWNACPFECCVYRTWTAKSVVKVFRERRLGSPVAFELRAGEAVHAFTGVVVTRKAGEVSALRDGFVGESNIPIRVGEVVRVLRPQGEGLWKIWFKGQVDSEDLLNLDDAVDKGWKLLSRPEVAWWVKVRTVDGRVGWTIATEKFDGTDACG